MQTDLDRSAVDIIVDAVAERIRYEIQKAVLAANVRILAGGKAVVSRGEAAIILNLSSRTLEKWASEGKGPRSTQFNRSIGHTIEALGEYVDSHQSPALPAAERLAGDGDSLGASLERAREIVRGRYPLVGEDKGGSSARPRKVCAAPSSTGPRPRPGVKRRVAEVNATPAERPSPARPSKTSQPAFAADEVPAQ
jgi:hypothetical protein